MTLGYSEYWGKHGERSTGFETAGGAPEVLRMNGKAFGKFNRQLRDFAAGSLMEGYQIQTFSCRT